MTTTQSPRITDLFPAQFEGGEYFLGISIGEGWKPIVIDACKAIQDALTPSEIKLFHWIQIKEKFAGLQMYWGPNNVIPVTIIGPDKITNIDVESKSTEPGFAPETVAKINAIVKAAQKRAAKTCEECGTRARLYAGAYWQTHCDEHAAEGERLFPAAYGKVIESRPQTATFGDREAISQHAIYFKNSGGRVWHFADNQKGPRFMFSADLPDALVQAYVDGKDGSIDIPYSDPADEADPDMFFSTIDVDDLLRVLKKLARKDGTVGITEAYLSMPKGVRRDTRTQLERDIECYHGVAVKIDSRIDAETVGGFALGKTGDGSMHLFSITDPNAPARLDAPAEAIQAEIEKLDRVRERLTGMLTNLEKHHD